MDLLLILYVMKNLLIIFYCLDLSYLILIKFEFYHLLINYVFGNLMF